MHFQEYSAEPSEHAGFVYMKDVVKLMEVTLSRQNEFNPCALHESTINHIDKECIKW